MYKIKEFKSDEESLVFVNNNDIEIISTHATPSKHRLKKDHKRNIL